MRDPWNARSIIPGLLVVLAMTVPARAGKLSWLDDVVRQVVREAETGGKAAAKGTGRLFVREADEGLETLVKRSDDLARVVRRADEPAETALRTRFTRLVRHDPEMARTFTHLAPAEQRLVVEMGETAQRLARRYPGRAEPMIRALGTDGLSAVRVYGDDVAEVLVKEGSESLNVLRKSGRGGWSFYTGTVLKHKKKLAAAGVLGLFLANPDQFVDTAGQATRYAVEQFAKAGIQLAGAVGSGASKGLESALGQTFAACGIDSTLARKAGMIGAAMVAMLAVLVILGIPVAWLFRPLTWPLRLVKRRVVRATP